MGWWRSAACAAVIAGATPAAAETLSSPPIFGGFRQTAVVCYLFNAGTSAITISKLVIYTESGAIAGQTGTCPAKLQPNKTCQLAPVVVSNTAHICKVTLSDKANARGSVEVRDANSNILARADLR